MHDNTLTIKKPFLSSDSGWTRIAAEIVTPSQTSQLWFELKAEHAHYLTPETSDGFLVALLILGMKNNWDIVVEGPLSSQLYYNITSYHMELLRNLIPRTHKIQIKPSSLIQTNWGGKGVFTGFSAGIDSFCTIADHLPGKVPPEYVVTHLVFNNVGSHGQGINDLRVFQARYGRLQPFAHEMGLPFFSVNSNLDAILGIRELSFQLTHTMRNVAVALLFQKACSKYLYSSTVHYRDAYVRETYDVGYADAIGVGLLSTETTECISSGGQHTRFEKTGIVSSFHISRQSLDICVEPQDAVKANCSKCWKCLRTELSLEIIGSLHEYDRVFDLDTYDKYRWLYICNVLGSTNPLLIELKEAMRNSSFTIPASARIAAAMFPNKVIDKIGSLWAESSANPLRMAYRVLYRAFKKLLA